MICLEIPPPTFDFIDAYYMIITSMIGKREKNSHRAKRMSVGLYRLAPRYLVLHTMFLAVLAVAIVVAVVGNISYAKTDSGGGAGKKDEFPIGQYCKEQEALGKNPIICKSPEEQGKAKINDPTGYQKAMEEYEKVKAAHIKGKNQGNNQNNNNQNQGNNNNQNQNQGNNQNNNNQSQGGNNQNQNGGNGNSNGSSNGGGGGSGGGSTCGSAHTFFDWGCNGVDDKDSILTVLVTISNWLAAGVVIAVIGGIIYGAIMYATSAGDASKAKSATEIIRNAFIALILYFLMWAFLQYIVPGGLFG